MRYYLILITILFSSASFAQDTLKFINLSEHDYELKKFYDSAELYNKNILIYFSGDGCAPCIRMQKEVFTNQEVIKPSRDLILLRSHLVMRPYPMPSSLDRKVNKEHRKLGKKLGHDNAYPTFYILNQEGDILTKKNSMTVEEFLEFLKT